MLCTDYWRLLSWFLFGYKGIELLNVPVSDEWILFEILAALRARMFILAILLVYYGSLRIAV